MALAGAHGSFDEIAGEKGLGLAAVVLAPVDHGSVFTCIEGTAVALHGSLEAGGAPIIPPPAKSSRCCNKSTV